jgi:hypothetical protein
VTEGQYKVIKYILYAIAWAVFAISASGIPQTAFLILAMISMIASIVFQFKDDLDHS